MSPVEEYRDQAQACALVAQKAADRKDKALWLFMAEAWLALANDAARVGSVIAPSEKVSGQAA